MTIGTIFFNFFFKTGLSASCVLNWIQFAGSHFIHNFRCINCSLVWYPVVLLVSLSFLDEQLVLHVHHLNEPVP